MKTDNASTQTPEIWVLATHRQPPRGSQVMVGRERNGRIEALDQLYWYPEIGNWNLNGMYWRELPP